MKTLGIVLIVVTGLLTFHPPHFLLEAGRRPASATAVVLEIGLAVNLLAALIAAVGIARNARWGWALGIVIAVAAVVLYLISRPSGCLAYRRTGWSRAGSWRWSSRSCSSPWSAASCVTSQERPPQAGAKVRSTAIRMG